MDGIFPDVDRSVLHERTDQGLLVLATCGVCGRRVKVMFPWHELRAVLAGQPVYGMDPCPGGWRIEAPCSPICRARVRFDMRAEELRGLL